MKTCYLVLLVLIVSVSNVFALDVPLIDEIVSSVVVKKDVPENYTLKNDSGVNSATAYFTIGELFYEVSSDPFHGNLKITIFWTEENERWMISNISFSRQKIVTNGKTSEDKFKWNCDYLYISKRISENGKNSIFNEHSNRRPESYFSDISESVATDFINKHLNLIYEIYKS